MATPEKRFLTSPWVRRIILALAIAGLGYLGLLLVLSRTLDPETLATRIEPRLEAVLGRDVEIGTAKVGFFPLGMRLEDISVADPTGLTPTLAGIRAVEFQIRLVPLLRKEVRIRQLVLEEPEAHLRIDMDGRSNFGDLSAAGQDEAPGGTSSAETGDGFALELQGVRMVGGHMDFRNDRDTTSVTLKELRLRATVRREASGPWIFVGGSQGEVTWFRGQEDTPPLGLPMALTFDIMTDSTFDTLQIRSGSLGTAPVALALSGTVEGVRDPIRSLSLSLTGKGIPLAQLLEALPDSARKGLSTDEAGRVALNLQVQGAVGPGERPEVRGTAKLSNAQLRSPDGAQIARNLSADASLGADGKVELRAEGEVMDGPFSLEGQGKVTGGRTVDLRLDAYPDLSLAESLVEFPEGVTAQGRVKADLRMVGSLKEPRGLRFWGKVSPNQLRLTTPSVAVPISLPRGAVTLNGNRATFQDLPFSLDFDEFLASGELRDLTSFGQAGRTLEVNASIRGLRLDLMKINPKAPPDPSLSYGKVAFAKVGGRQVAGRSVEEAARELRLARPDSIPVAGRITLALDTVIDPRGRMEDVRAVAEFGPDFLRVTEATFKRYGGTLRTSMNLALGDDPQEPFSMSLSLEDLDAVSFLSATSFLGDIFEGRLSLNLDLVGSLDDLLLPQGSSLVGSGSFSLTDGGMNPIRVTESLSTFLGLDDFRAPEIQRWSSALVLENGKIRLADASLNGAPGEPRLGGSIGLDGGLDLLSVFSLPSARLGSYARENLGLAGEIAGRVANRPDVVQAVIRIGGSLVSPDLSADPGASVQTITQAVRAEVQTEAQQKIQAETTRLQNRAAGFLRGITQRREAQTPPPADTLRPDTTPQLPVQPDTLRPDTLQPDTLQPDTVQPHTLQPDTIPPDTLGAIPGASVGTRPVSPSSGSLESLPAQEDQMVGIIRRG